MGGLSLVQFEANEKKKNLKTPCNSPNRSPLRFLHTDTIFPRLTKTQPDDETCDCSVCSPEALSTRTLDFKGFESPQAAHLFLLSGRSPQTKRCVCASGNGCIVRQYPRRAAGLEWDMCRYFCHCPRHFVCQSL